MTLQQPFLPIEPRCQHRSVRAPSNESFAGANAARQVHLVGPWDGAEPRTARTRAPKQEVSLGSVYLVTPNS